MISVLLEVSAVFVICAIKVIIIASSASLLLIFCSFVAVNPVSINCICNTIFTQLALLLPIEQSTTSGTTRASYGQPLLIRVFIQSICKMKWNNFFNLCYVQIHVLHFDQQPCDGLHLVHQQNARCVGLHTWQKAETTVIYPWHHGVA